MSIAASEVLLSAGAAKASPSQQLRATAQAHPASRHPVFWALQEESLDSHQVAGLLKNYDAHASVLRRLLLKAATLMPEPAVGFILENVRNEYGNGIYQNNHQFQLKSVARQAGVDESDWKTTCIQPGVKRFIQQVHQLYFPRSRSGLVRAAIAAGAITATELLAVEEFRAMQKALAKFGLDKHVWFEHVTIEEEHSHESLDLALYFADSITAFDSVKWGMQHLLDASIDLYDGLLSAMRL